MDGLIESGFVSGLGPLADENQVVRAIQAESEEAVRETLGRDPWTETHLRIVTIYELTIRFDGRSV